MLRRSRRAGMWMLALAVPALAQFADLATTDDGSQLYFASQMQLQGKPPAFPRESRVYRFSLSRVSLYAERLAPIPESALSDGMGAMRPSISGDGEIVGLTMGYICGDAACESATDRVQIRGKTTLDLGRGDVQVSRNGRWALVSRRDWEYTPKFVTYDFTTRIDLSTGQKTELSLTAVYRVGANRPLVLTSDGSVLGARDGVYGLFQLGRFTPIPIPAGRDWRPFAISDDGRTVVCQEYSNQAVSRLVALSPATGSVAVIAEADRGDAPVLLSISNNGARVLYKRAAQWFDGSIYLWDASTGRSTRVPLDPGEAGNDGVLSGNGEIAYVATTRARILRYSMATNVLSLLFPAPPQCEIPGPLARGSLGRLRCSFGGSVAELQGKILFDAAPVPVVASSAGEIAIQIPWERGYLADFLTFDVPGASPFEGSQEVRTWALAPEILADERGIFGMKAVRGDWTGALNVVPAAGEFFHIYMSGLGGTKKPETSGVPASLTELNPIEAKLDCGFQPGFQRAELVFAGLAPGMLGVYQATFRVPDLGRQGATGFECRMVTAARSARFGPGLPVYGMEDHGAGAAIQ